MSWHVLRRARKSDLRLFIACFPANEQALLPHEQGPSALGPSSVQRKMIINSPIQGQGRYYMQGSGQKMTKGRKSDLRVCSAAYPIRCAPARYATMHCCRHEYPDVLSQVSDNNSSTTTTTNNNNGNNGSNNNNNSNSNSHK